MALPLSRLPAELIREMIRWRWAAAGLAVLVSFAVLAVGFIYPYQYRSDVVIYLDNTNIIRPLMEGSAEITGISDQASSARELLWSRNVLEKIIEDERIFGAQYRDMSVEQRERLFSELRRGINVVPQGKSYFSVRYTGNDPRRTYLIAQRLGQLFLEETNRRKRDESRNAYEFVDKQVQSYEAQINRTEEKLKEFLSKNVDGTEGDVNARMSQLRATIENTKMELAEAQTQRRSLEEQAQRIPQMTGVGGTEDSISQRIAAAEQRLDELRLSYHDTYPDVITLKQQIEDLRERREMLQAEADGAPIETGEQVPNPLFQDLQTELSRAETREQTLHTRIAALKQRLENEKGRMERIQANRAEHAELTRDLQVNQDIFNDLLRRRERARVSMHLDVEGQGLSFQIHEQAQFPLNPTGLQFQSFASVGWLLGLLAPFGLIAGLLQIDPRVRSEHQIRDELDIPLLGSLPLVKTPYERRRERRSYIGLGLVIVLGAAGYVAVVILQGTGVLA